ncbi:hypothetical protein CALCODRAFT_404835, partial [Calocera cornea HHB12733]
SLLESFLASLQAVLSLLLTLLYGVGASKLGLLSTAAAKDVAHLCIEVFQPALIITQIGQNIANEGSSVFRLWRILTWGVAYPLLGLAPTYPGVRWVGLPSWALAAVPFNNTTALPLLLIDALATTGILELVTPDPAGARGRATTYFLLNAMVNNVLTFAIAPRLYPHSLIPTIEDADAEATDPGTEEVSDAEGEAAPLLRKVKQQHAVLKGHLWRGVQAGAHGFARLPRPVKKALVALRELVNPPLVGTLLAGVIGLNPVLRTAFFAKPQEGGIFRAWLTSSLQEIGGLYSSRQMFVVGSKLYESGKPRPQDKELRLWPVAYILFLRFLLLPVLSIGLFAPAGPSAINISSIAEVAGAGEVVTQQIARFLTLSYALSPLISLAVVGSVQAAAAA